MRSGVNTFSDQLRRPRFKILLDFDVNNDYLRLLDRWIWSAPNYLLVPGLTALHESMALGQLPLAIHEQHYAHIFTMRLLDGTLFGQNVGRFADILPDHPIPEDDFAGTAALVKIAGRVREDDELYAKFRKIFNERIEKYISLTPEQRQHGVEELRNLLHGEPIHSVMARIITTQPSE
jgi:hypothetical protein